MQEILVLKKLLHSPLEFTRQISSAHFQGSQNKTAFKLLITSIRQQKRFNYCQLKWPWENLQDSGSSLGLDFISMNKRH